MFNKKKKRCLALAGTTSLLLNIDSSIIMLKSCSETLIVAASLLYLLVENEGSLPTVGRILASRLADLVHRSMPSDKNTDHFASHN